VGSNPTLSASDSMLLIHPQEFDRPQVFSLAADACRRARVPTMTRCIPDLPRRSLALALHQTI
jgi:hypothetical protein